MTHNNPDEFKSLPHATCLVLIGHDGKLAVCSRRNSDIYVLPGGKKDVGETIEQAGAREAHDEIGVYIESSKLQSIYAAPIPGDVSYWCETFAHRTHHGTDLSM